ncbi:Tn3 family transposase [Plantactinospora sp. B6F1]|uniref:Tn3 family transposase n=1 Tax=Plantactinospora sp. B6F1 TaxID=3158971 RepID=UPI0032D9243A
MTGGARPVPGTARRWLRPSSPAAATASGYASPRRCARSARVRPLGLVLNCITLWNTLYLNHALDALRSQEYPVLEADAARLSAYQYKHINVHGHYSFALPDLDGARRPLRDPDAFEE